MADGQLNMRSKHVENYTLIDAESAAVNNGQWIDSSEFPEGSIEVVIADTATVQIRGTDVFAKPANGTHGQQIGSDITSTGLYSLTHPPRWLKARVSAWTAGQVDVIATLRRPS